MLGDEGAAPATRVLRAGSVPTGRFANGVASSALLLGTPATPGIVEPAPMTCAVAVRTLAGTPPRLETVEVGRATAARPVFETVATDFATPDRTREIGCDGTGEEIFACGAATGAAGALGVETGTLVGAGEAVAFVTGAGAAEVWLGVAGRTLGADGTDAGAVDVAVDAAELTVAGADCTGAVGCDGGVTCGTVVVVAMGGPPARASCAPTRAATRTPVITKSFVPPAESRILRFLCAFRHFETRTTPIFTLYACFFRLGDGSAGVTAGD